MEADPDKKNKRTIGMPLKDQELQNIESVDSHSVPGKKYPFAVIGGRENIVKVEEAKDHPRSGRSSTIRLRSGLAKAAR